MRPGNPWSSLPGKIPLIRRMSNILPPFHKVEGSPSKNDNQDHHTPLCQGRKSDTWWDRYLSRDTCYSYGRVVRGIGIRRKRYRIRDRST